MPKQNIYDNETFFEGYKQIRERKGNANDLFEIPTLSSVRWLSITSKILQVSSPTFTICFHQAKNLSSRRKIQSQQVILLVTAGLVTKTATSFT